ncbi:hypothetical protein [Halolamina litorea]|uniref:Uncharacterized protein n=1 Tax=Halolamina litorea TaxID=1515593 RepID=A0ABD6BSV9_9EURY|nr:hypothetical protein [Halolamina litorea]
MNATTRAGSYTAAGADELGMSDPLRVVAVGEKPPSATTTSR